MNETRLPSIGTSEAAKLLGVTWKTANKWMHSGKLQAVKVGGRYRTTLQWIDAVATAVPTPVPRPDLSHGVSDAEHEATVNRLKARFGLKMSSAVTRKARRRNGNPPGGAVLPSEGGPGNSGHDN